MREPARAAVPRLVYGVDGQRSAMREQRRLSVAVERDKRLPERVVVLGQQLYPSLMTGLDRLGRGAVREAGGLRGETCASRRNFEAGPGWHAIEGLQAERVQNSHEGHAGIIGQRVSQRERAVCRELDDQPFGQWSESIILVDVGSCFWRWGGDSDDGALDCRTWFAGHRTIRIVTLGWLGGRLVLRTDITALDLEIAVVVDADEYACARDLDRIVDHGTLVKSLERGLDFAQPLVDLLGQFVDVDILLLEPIELSAQGLAGCALIVGEIEVSPCNRCSPFVWP
jgi:hypothetical protein